MRPCSLLDEQGAENFFGEPALELADIRRVDFSGRGVINVLAADKLIHKPRLYATFLLWLLSELFEELPEVGDPDKPGLVFFFDEAHLLFDHAPKALLQKLFDSQDSFHNLWNHDDVYQVKKVRRKRKI